MSGLTPENGLTEQAQDVEIKIEFCGMTELQINYFKLLNPDGTIFGAAGNPNYTVNVFSYYATLQPTVDLVNGATYTVEIDGRINDGGTVKAIAAGTWAFTTVEAEVPDRIQLYSSNNWYWQYKGQPTLLLGGSIHSNLFQYSDLQSQMDEIAAAGGNYVINLMSQREIWNLAGTMERPYAQSGSTFNLNQWNTTYWTMFSNMLSLANERDIIVQVEFWDRWDFCSTSWSDNAFRPANNSNYTTGASGLPDTQACSSWLNIDFFRTVPAIDNNTTVLPFQQAFVNKVLSYTLQYSNILYCISNESEAAEAWGEYWSTYIKAAAADVDIETAQMWDDRIMNSTQQKYSFDHPETYSFLDISQNSHQDDQTHWDGLQYARTYVSGAPLPINHGKTYGSPTSTSGDTAQAIARLWRNVIGGAASHRFHRPGGGIGINQDAKDAIAGVRLLETKVTLWEMTPQQGLLSDRSSNEAYLSAEVGQQYALFFTNGGAVGLNLSAYGGSTFDIDWIDGDAGTWGTPDTVAGGSTQTITAPGSGPWVAAIVLQ